jgi:hypothetical protein
VLAFFAKRLSRARRHIGVELTVLALLLTTASLARARSGGIEATGCDTCHRGGKVPQVTLTADPPNPAVGQPLTLTIGVSQANGATAGFYLTTAHEAPGTFQAFEAGTLLTSSGVIHSTPRAGSNGTTTFQARWTASQATGVAFDVYALSANGNKANSGDGAGSAELELLIGCTGSTYFIDQDGDGYGSADPAYAPRKDCVTPQGYAPNSSDCDDFHADVHPGAAEQCDLKDNDCDGAADNDVVYQAFCEDKDGDGHGAINGAQKMDCKPSQGFAACDDCDDRAKATYPGAAEVCDGFDNDCDGKVDEGVRPSCGVGLCSRYALGCSSNCTPGEPRAETCNGFDDDCDGAIDNGPNQALCVDGNQACVGGSCVPAATGAAGNGASASGGSNPGSGAGSSVSSGGAAPGESPNSTGPSGCALRSREPGAGPSPLPIALLIAACAALARKRSQSHGTNAP